MNRSYTLYIAPTKLPRLASLDSDQHSARLPLGELLDESAREAEDPIPFFRAHDVWVSSMLTDGAASLLAGRISRLRRRV